MSLALSCKLGIGVRFSVSCGIGVGKQAGMEGYEC